MRKKLELTGERFGRLRVLREGKKSKYGAAQWDCLCDCGTFKTIIGSSLKTGLTRSCGCLNNETWETMITKHNLVRHPLYETWAGMNKRCTNPRSKNYCNYGGRGISVCARWKDSFPNFLEDMGEKPSSKYSLDRINNDGNYEATNCRWATRSQQNLNKRTTKKITIHGEVKPLRDWFIYYGVSLNTYHARKKRGWSTLRALSAPIKKMRSNILLPRHHPD